MADGVVLRCEAIGVGLSEVVVYLIFIASASGLGLNEP
jgi:hypothetical protein